jgi:hypothetical protein
VLDTTPQGGTLGEGCLTPVEKPLKELSETELLVGWDRDGAVKSVDDHASVGDTLGRFLPFVVAEAEAEFVSETVPIRLRASSRPCRSRADRAAAFQAGAGRVRRSLGGIDGIVNPHGAVQCSVV